MSGKFSDFDKGRLIGMLESGIKQKIVCKNLIYQNQLYLAGGKSSRSLVLLNERKDRYALKNMIYVLKELL